MSEHAELLPELLERCRQRDPQAVARLVGRFYSYALTLARALVDNPHDAQDVVQAAMLTMLTRLDALRDPNAFPGWLRQIVRTHANRLRRRGSSQQVLKESEETTSPFDAAHLVEVRHQVQHALAQLSSVNHQAAQLFYLDERTQSEIAAELDVPLGTVKRRLHDARVKLRKLLEDSQLPL
jgi:RNA polymerase sigma-70 factor (ECF subfamily)